MESAALIIASCGVRTHAQLPAVDLKSTPLTTRANLRLEPCPKKDLHHDFTRAPWGYAQVWMPIRVNTGMLECSCLFSLAGRAPAQ